MALKNNRTSLQETVEVSPDKMSVGQVSVGAVSAAQLLGANGTRRFALVTNHDASIALFVGTSSGVTTSTGHRVGPGLSLTVSYTGAIYGIAASGTITVSASELYD